MTIEELIARLEEIEQRSIRTEFSPYTPLLLALAREAVAWRVNFSDHYNRSIKEGDNATMYEPEEAIAATDRIAAGTGIKILE